MTKEHLGDSVYIAVEYGMWKLTTENGGEAPSNIIYMDSHVMSALISYLQDHVPGIFIN